MDAKPNKTTGVAKVPPATIGRPAVMSGGKRVNVYLDADSLDRAAKLGDGNVSEGIRRSLAVS